MLKYAKGYPCTGHNWPNNDQTTMECKDPYKQDINCIKIKGYLLDVELDDVELVLVIR